jgi:hypothetical protein
MPAEQHLPLMSLPSHRLSPPRPAATSASPPELWALPSSLVVAPGAGHTGSSLRTEQPADAAALAPGPGTDAAAEPRASDGDAGGQPQPPAPLQAEWAHMKPFRWDGKAAACCFCCCLLML